MVLSSLLSSSKYIIVNKDLIKVLGLHESIILGELCSEYTYWESVNQLEQKEYFYSTRNNIEKNTGINAHYQRIAMKNLEEKGIVISKRMGIPCKKYYKIDEDKVIEYLKKAKVISNSTAVHDMEDKQSTECICSNLLDEAQDENVLNTNNNNINNNINNKEEHTHAKNLVDEKKEYAKEVTMTEKEYQDLVYRYGKEKTNSLIEQLSLYKQANGKTYQSDYAAILRWVTVKLHEIEQEETKYREFKNKNKKPLPEEFPPGFYDSLYCN